MLYSKMTKIKFEPTNSVIKVNMVIIFQQELIMRVFAPVGLPARSCVAESSSQRQTAVTNIVGGCGAIVLPQTGSAFLQHNYKQPYNEIKLAKKTSTTHNKAQLWLCTVVFWQQRWFLQAQYEYKIKIHLHNFYTEMQDWIFSE
jgi:hypothetical protein